MTPARGSTNKVRAGLYVRISEDRDDLAAGVGRQEQDCRALAKARGWDVAEVYTENDTSAFKRRTVTLPDGTRARRVVRPEFRRLLADLADGTITALVGYDLDRIARDPRDLEDLIDVVEDTGHPAVSATGSLDLPAGITLARVAVAMANQSSRDTARRVARARQGAAENGRWAGGGRRAYGYTADRTAVITSEADTIASIAADVLAGKSLYAITERLNTDNVPTASGAPWSPRAVRGVVTKPTVAGKLVHKGEIVGDAPWPAILDEDTWTRVCEELSTRTPRATNQLTHWLTGILRCGHCGLPLRGNGGRYWCGNTASRGQKGCGRISITAAPTEELVRDLVLTRVKHVRARPARAANVAPDDTQLRELAKMWGNGEMTLAEYREARAAIVARLTEQAAPKAPPLPAWVGPQLAEQWDDLDATARRRVASTLIDGITVRPAAGRVFDPDRLDVHWRG